MAEAASAVARPETPHGARAAIDFGLGLGSGVAAGAVGSLIGLIAAQLLLLLGQDTVSIASVVTRVVLALGLVVAGVILASHDRLPLVIGAGALVGGPLGVVFGGVSWAGLAWASGLGAAAGLVGTLLTFTQIPPLARREFSAYFLSPIAYVVATVFLFFFGFFQYMSMVQGGEVSIAMPILYMTMFFLPIMAPVLTMRLFAEEKRSGTMEVLMTAPVRDWEVVAAKFLSSLAAFGMILAPTLVHVLALFLVSERGPAPGPLVGSYLGLTLTVALFLSLGILASALSRDQIVAAIVGFAFSFAVFFVGIVPTLAGQMEWFRENKFAKDFFEFVSYGRHMEMFLQGKIETRSVFFFASLVVFILFLTTRVVESRKWR